MAHDPMNPFGLPHMGTSMNNPAQNPLLASMDMMRQAMAGLGQSAQTATGSISSALTPEDLERKISELKVVENWLKLNLSVLSGSIQGLEVQLATVRTLRSFVAMGGTPTTTTDGAPSPLEIVLGLKPAPSKAKVATPERPTANTHTEDREVAPASEPVAEDLADNTKPNNESSDSTNAAAQAWWKMIEGQFAQLAAATTQANAAAQAAVSKATQAKPPVSRAASTQSAARKSATKKAAVSTATRRASPDRSAKRPTKQATKRVAK